ncbi:hypothetical protein AVEN_143661-1 [Araneus ventricosus]|uniref:Uncharacterized protein n=1 Tax=Araneus ventricosus TaxID=182803 RepID=A0A4Y2AQ90_ARAVE|nr:hypothetical protein AVEN_143661-1 [Araneus ventricosus]
MQNGPPKGHLSSRDAFGYTRGQKTPVRLSEFQFPELGFTNKNDGGSTPPFYFPSLFSLFLNILPSKDRRLVIVLPPGDSSSSWTYHPTAVVCLPSWCLFFAVNLKRKSLSV